MNSFIRGHNRRQLLYAKLDIIDRSMLLLALFPCKLDHGICHYVDLSKHAGSLHHIVWAWIHRQRAMGFDKKTFMYRVIALGYVDIMKMIITANDIDQTMHRNIICAAAESGSEDMIRAVWDLNVYCDHKIFRGHDCCVDIAIFNGHLLLAEKLAWGALTCKSIAELKATGKFTPLRYSNEKLKLDWARDFDLVCWRDEPLYDNLTRKLATCTSADMRDNIIDRSCTALDMYFPVMRVRTVIDYFASVGDLSTLEQLHSHGVDIKHCDFGSAAKNGHLDVIKWAHEYWSKFDKKSLYLVRKAISGRREHILEYLFSEPSVIEHFNTKVGETSWLPVYSAKHGYEIYRVVERLCADIDSFEIKHNVIVKIFFKAIYSGDMRTIEYVYAKLREYAVENVHTNSHPRVDDNGNIVQMGSVLDHFPELARVYRYANGNIAVIQWLNDNIMRPLYVLHSVLKVRPWSKRLAAVQKLIELGASLSPKSLGKIIEAEDGDLVEWLNEHGYLHTEMISAVKNTIIVIPKYTTVEISGRDVRRMKPKIIEMRASDLIRKLLNK